MKPAREPASSRPKPCTSLKKPHESCPFALLMTLVGRKKAVVRHQLFPQKPPGFRLDSRAQGFSPSLARRRSSCPPPSPNLVRTHPIEHYQALRDSALCLSRAATPPEGHQTGARKRRAPGNTILSQPYRRRVTLHRLLIFLL